MTTAFPELRPRVANFLLLLILLAGLTLRVWNVNFDQGIGSHPDERSTACFYAVGIKLPSSWEQFRDPKQSPLNPLWDTARQERRGFTYGHFPLYLGVAMGELMSKAAPLGERVGLPESALSLMQRAGDSCDAIAVAGRLTIALLDTLTILLLYLLGRRLYGRGGGLLAAALYAFAAQAIQLSHFFAMDPAGTTFTVLAVLGAVIMVQERRWRGVWIAGIGAGLAISSKFSALPILAAPVVAAVCILWQEWRGREGDARGPDGRAQLVAVLGLFWALILAAVFFTVTSPYAVLDWRNFLQATLVEQGRMVRGVADFPFTRQYRNTIPYLYFIEQQVRWGLGLPLGLAALAGSGWALVRLGQTLWRLVRGRTADSVRLSELVVWSWLIPYFGLTGAFLAKFNRYMSPVLPFVLLFAAGLVVWLWREFNLTPRPPLHTGEGEGSAPLSARRGEGVRWAGVRWAGALLGVVAVAGGIFWSLAYVNGVYGREHTWLTASRWLYQNAPRDSAILWELWDDPLPKSIPGEAGMDMGTTGLRNIDWSPYEEDTADKYAILKQKIFEADFVAYSSKRIYDSVDELPERYPMTTLYYAAMWDGRLGFELAADVTSPPQLFGFSFDDRNADESWSLYDHPQATIFRKVRELSDAEFDAIFAGTWEKAIPYYRGKDSPLSPLFNLVGLGSSEESANRGLINRVITAVTGADSAPEPHDPDALLLDVPLRELPVVDNYRWNTRASAQPWLAVLTWWGVTTLLGWLVWPPAFALFRPLRDRGYMLSRALGWLLAAWLLWMAASLRVAQFSVVNAWVAVGVVGVAGLVFAVRNARDMARFVRDQGIVLLVGEAVFGAALLAFVGIRMLNPDIWQPWYGGEKFMEVAFLNGILRSPYFPPVDPHFAGGFINYYYFGIYLVGYLIKLTGISTEVAFNLAIPTLFALTVSNSFSVAWSAQPEAWRRGGRRRGLGAALLGPLFVVIIGNLDGFAQIVRSLAGVSSSSFESALPGVESSVRALDGIRRVANGAASLPGYDFWGPSRVLPATINEFPWWSFLFADLHPHLIGIPFAVLFLALVLTLLRSGGTEWARNRAYAGGLLAAFALLLGTLASVNLWELPTYFVLGALALVVAQFHGKGRIHWGMTMLLAAAYGVGAGLLFAPFFLNYTNIGASGVGLVRAGDDPGLWLLIWGFLGFMLVSWLFWTMAQPARRSWERSPSVRPSGVERLLSLALRRFDTLPRVFHLQRVLDLRPRFGYLLLLLLIPLAAVGAALAFRLDRVVLALCLLPLTLAFVLLWRRGRSAEAGTQFAVLLSVAGLAILAGTQVIYLKDFLSGGDWYRMNTLFKFFMQVWVLFGLAAAIVLPRFWLGWVEKGEAHWIWRRAWSVLFGLLLAASLTYTLIGTPARLNERLAGWRPPLGTLNGLDYMREGTYTWPDGSNVIELSYEWSALQWLLQNVRGNATIVESSEVDYYRAGSSRAASLTGLSGLRGMHESEQRFGDQLGPRDALHREFWITRDPARMTAILDELQVDLIYVGQLERYLHGDAVARLEQLAAAGTIQVLYANERTTIYGVGGFMGGE